MGDVYFFKLYCATENTLKKYFYTISSYHIFALYCQREVVQAVSCVPVVLSERSCPSSLMCSCCVIREKLLKQSCVFVLCYQREVVQAVSCVCVVLSERSCSSSLSCCVIREKLFKQSHVIMCCQREVVQAVSCVHVVLSERSCSSSLM